MANQEYILKHYRNIAESYGLSSKSSMADTYIREAELSFIHGEIFKYIAQNQHMPKILELGCGNGFLLETLSQNFPELDMTAIELSPDLFKLAKKRKISKLKLINQDMLKAELEYNSFDIIITERSIINLSSQKQQRMAYQKISKWLKSGGHYLMIESYKEGLANLNHARRESGLEELSASPHNCYLTKGTEKLLNNVGLKKGSCFLEENYLSTHFFLTRILHPLLMNKGQKVKEGPLVHFFNMAFPGALGDYSPIKLQHYIKIESI